MKEIAFNIAAVEREVGVTKDVLRVWERRYGFPKPERDAHGERVYSAEQVQRLRTIKRLMDQGHRPGRLLGATAEELETTLAATRRGANGAAAPAAPDELQDIVDLVCSHDARGFLAHLQQRLARQGLRPFVLDTVAPLSARIGIAWEQGRLEVYEEHLFTELTTRTLRQAIASVPPSGAPTVLLTTLPNEPHALGLLMVEALLVLEGATCVSLGTQTPIVEIAQAAQAYRADVVALSFSAAFPQRQAAPLVRQLRAVLAAPVGLWVGGSGTAAVRDSDGVLVIGGLDDAAAAVQRWRDQRASDAVT